MDREYPVLAHQPLPSGARVAAPPPPSRLTLESPALEAMTDLTRIRAATIAPQRTLAECNFVMVARAVRMLFVEDASRVIVGVITATDLLGEKPMRFVQERGVTHDEILVSDLMTRASGLETLDLQEVSHAQVGQVVATLKAAGREHTFVTDEDGKRICGVFSASDIARRVGTEVPTEEIAASFAEIEAALSK